MKRSKEKSEIEDEEDIRAQMFDHEVGKIKVFESRKFVTKYSRFFIVFSLLSYYVPIEVQS